MFGVSKYLMTLTIRTLEPQQQLISSNAIHTDDLFNDYGKEIQREKRPAIHIHYSSASS